MKTGIVRYNNHSTDDPTDRFSKPWSLPPTCDDEPLGNIRPKHKWTIGPSKNSITHGESVALSGGLRPPPYIHAKLLWDIKKEKSTSKHNFQIRYDDPIFLRLDKPEPRLEEVVVYSSENFTANDWVCQFSCRVCLLSSHSRCPFSIDLHHFRHLFSLLGCLNHPRSFSLTTCRTGLWFIVVKKLRNPLSQWHLSTIPTIGNSS